MGTTLTSQNSIQEEIKSRLKSGNACCHSVQKVRVHTGLWWGDLMERDHSQYLGVDGRIKLK